MSRLFQRRSYDSLPCHSPFGWVAIPARGTMLLRPRAWLVAVLFVVSLSRVGVSQTDLPEGAKSLRTLDLPVPAPALLPSPDGKYLVCVQWMPAGFAWRDTTSTMSQIQVIVVDLERL